MYIPKAFIFDEVLFLQAIPRSIDRLYEPWMLWVFVACLAMLALVRVQFPRYIQLVRWSFNNYRIAKQTFAQGDLQSRPEWLITLPLTLFGYGMFLYLLINYLKGPETLGFTDFLRLVLAVGVILILKVLAGYLVEALSHRFESIRVYLGNTFLIGTISGALLLLLSMAVALDLSQRSQWYFIAGVSLILVTYLFRLGRGVGHAIDERISLNYIILYLCTLEFLPAGVLLKALVSTYAL